jgi:hypothetical protein
MYVDKSKLDLDHNKLSYPRTHFRMSNWEAFFQVS